MTVQRVVGWQRKLNEYILEVQERHKRVGFVWGEFDCVHFVGDWIKLLSGGEWDPLADYRGTYGNREEALLLLGDGGLLGKLTEVLGEPVHPSQAHRGDIAFFDLNQGYRGEPEAAPIDCCGIFFTSGTTRALFLAEGGMALHRARDVHYAFRI